MEWDGKKLTIDNSDCVRCMHCINVMPKALRPGKERGATLLLGAKAPIVQGALLSSVLVPFVPAEELMETMKELLSRIWEFWDEHGKNRERVGELIQRVGLANFLDGDRARSGAGDGHRAARQSVHLLQDEEASARRRNNMAAAPQRKTDIGPPHYREVPAPDHQEELRQVEVPRDAGAGRAVSRGGIRRQDLHACARARRGC